MRRLMVPSTMIAVRGSEEFVWHVRARLDGRDESRVRPDDIKEVSDQAAMYCGVQAAYHAMSGAAVILREKCFLEPKDSP